MRLTREEMDQVARDVRRMYQEALEQTKKVSEQLNALSRAKALKKASGGR